MALWLHSLLMVIQSAALLQFVKGALQCACTTDQCRESGHMSCIAESMCYVQYMPAGQEDDHPPMVSRGCMDAGTPLLCENKRPDVSRYNGPWPILLCCRENYCNQNTLPTMPPWAHNIKNKTKTTEAPPAEKTRKPINIKDLPRETYSILSEEGHLHNMKTRRVRTINPLYIAVPIAGACVLLAIIVFAIYVLRRQNQYIEECRYHSNIRQSAYTKHPIIIKEIDSSSTKKMFYPDCERSSSGSETKLLMKV